MDRIGRRDPAQVIAIGGLMGLCFAAGTLTLHHITGSADGPRFAMSTNDGPGLYGSLPADPWGTAPISSRLPLAPGASDLMAMAGMAPTSSGGDAGVLTPKIADAQALTCDRFPCETIPSLRP